MNSISEENVTKKKKEGVIYSELSADELSRKLDQSKQDLFRLRFKAASAALKNPMEIRQLRREVARLSTFLNQRRQVK